MSEPNADEHPAQSEKTQGDETDETLFDYERVSLIVKDFITAWIENRIEIEFPSAEVIQTYSKRQGKNLTDAEADVREAEHKNEFEGLISIVAGEKPSTKEEYRKAVYGLFRILVMAREGKRITGTFSGASAQERLDDLERKINSTNKLVEQLLRFMRDVLGV